MLKTSRKHRCMRAGKNLNNRDNFEMYAPPPPLERVNVVLARVAAGNGVR